jgi:hypothetical protein
MSSPPTHASRGGMDLRMAESYLPAAVLWCKSMAYTCIILVAMFGGGARVPLVGAFILVLYYDHLYLDPYSFIDTTSICTDVVGAAVVQLLLIDPRDYRVSYVAPTVVWLCVGGAHIFAPPQLPHMAAHAATFVLLSAVLASTPSPGRDSGGGQADLIVAFVHTGVYVLLAIVDIYALRRSTQRESDRICLLRYGSTLVAPWPVGCIFAAVLFALQCARVYSSTSAASSTLPHTSQLAPSQLMSPAQLRQPPSVTPLPSTTCVSVAGLDVQEAFRIARIQYLGSNASAKNV